FANEFSVQIEELDLRARVFQIRRDEMVSDQIHAFERLWRLRHNLFPVRPVRGARINRDDAASWGVEVSAEPEDGAVVTDEVVRALGVVDQFAVLVFRALATARGTDSQFLVKNAIAGVCPLPDADYQITTVFGDPAAESPFLPVFAFVDQNVFRLRRAE